MTNPLRDRLRDRDPAVRASACRAIRDDPSAVLFLDALGDALADPAAVVGRAAVDALVALADRHREVDALLRRALRSDEPRRRFRAALASSQIAPPEPGLLPAVVEALSAPEPDVRWAAGRLLVDLGRLHAPVLPLALSLARTGPPPARRMALFCLRELAPEEPAVASAMIEASRDRDRLLRGAALGSMAALRDAPREATLQLISALESDPDPACRRLAAAALGEIETRDPDALSRTRTALSRIAAEDPDPDLRRIAARALTRAAADGGAAPQKTSESSE